MNGVVPLFVLVRMGSPCCVGSVGCSTGSLIMRLCWIRETVWDCDVVNFLQVCVLNFRPFVRPKDCVCRFLFIVLG